MAALAELRLDRLVSVRDDPTIGCRAVFASQCGSIISTDDSNLRHGSLAMAITMAINYSEILVDLNLTHKIQAMEAVLCNGQGSE